MSAFGKLLIEKWGGDINYYEGDKSKSENTEIVETKEEIEQHRFEFAKQRELSHAREVLYRLTNNISYRHDIAEQVTEVLFKDEYTKMNYSLEISNLMWLEYCEFINKYIKK